MDLIEKRIKTEKGIIIYRGPSLIDGAPIVAILTRSSKNIKTGDMLQLWIMRSDLSPIDAANLKKDYSICGNCKFRGESAFKRGCYVNLLTGGPSNIWKAYKNNSYVPMTEFNLRKFSEKKKIRLGAYGDPASLPIDVLKTVIKYSSGYTGYTHQWKEGFALQNILQASVENETEMKLAISYGYRVYFTTNGDDKPNKSFFRCPAYKGITCETCLACSGNNKGQKSNIYNPVHGGNSTLHYALKVLY